MKFDMLQILCMLALVCGIIVSAYSKSIEGIIGWANALMWFFIAQFALGEKDDE